MKLIRYHWELEVYKMSVEAAMRIFEYAVRCDYIPRKAGRELHRAYDRSIGKLVNMGNNSEMWVLRKSGKS